MNKRELKQRIASIEKELAELKNELKTQDKIWQPKNGDEFWIITGEGVVLSSRYYVINNEHYIKRCNYFQTEEEAKKQAEYNQVMNRFRKYVEAYSESLDWEDTTKLKYCIYFDNLDKRLYFDGKSFNQDAFQIYASSEEILKNAIIYSAGSEEEFIKIVFGGENGNNSDSTCYS